MNARSHLKVLFVNTVDLSQPIQLGMIPLAFGYLASYSRKHLPEVGLEFRTAEGDVGQTLDTWRPDVVAIGTPSMNFDIARAHAAAAAERSIPVVIGGQHISLLPESLSDDMSVAVIGEGEATFVELLAALASGSALDEPAELDKIPGLAYKRGGQVATTGRRDHIIPLDAVPRPDRKLLGTGRQSAVMFTSRGCVNRCIFCVSARFWHRIRYFSPAYVVAEIEDLHDNCGARQITFFDDLFVADKERLAQISAEVVKRRLHKRMVFNCLATAEAVDPQVVASLKRMNVARVAIGFESGNERVLRLLKGTRASVEANWRSARLLRDAGIEIEGSFIVGSSDETEEEIRDTLRFVQESGIDRFDVHLLTPFPGTPLWRDAREKGLVSVDMDWSRLYKNFQINPEESIVMAEQVSREKLHGLFLEFCALRDEMDAQLQKRTPILLDRSPWARAKHALRKLIG